MPGNLPATGSPIKMGESYSALSNGAKSNVKLSATLGPYVGKSAGTSIRFSQSLGGTPYTYTYNP